MRADVCSKAAQIHLDFSQLGIVILDFKVTEQIWKHNQPDRFVNIFSLGILLMRKEIEISFENTSESWF